MTLLVEKGLRRGRLLFAWASGGASRFVPPPRMAQIEVTNRCNLACRTCTRLKLPLLGDMSYEQFCTVLDRIGKVKRLWLSGQGEPLLHPELPRMIAACADRGIRDTILHTNATLLRGKMAEEIAASGLGEMRISIDGGTPDDMEYLRVGASFREVLDNVRAFTRLGGKVATAFYVLLNRRNHGSLAELPRIAAEVGVGRIYAAETVPFRDESAEREIYDRRAYQFASLPQEVRRATLRRLRMEGLRHGVDVRIDLKWDRKRCLEPFQKIYVDRQGQVTPCCRIHNEVIVGNLLQDGMAGSWYGRSMERWRKDLLRRDRHRRICIERCALGIGANGKCREGS